MKLLEAINKFVNSKGTRFEVAAKAYKSYILKFFEFIKKELTEVDNDDIVAFQMWMKTRYADSTRALYSIALREFFKFTNGRGWTKISREEITINKVYKKQMPYVVQSEHQMLCDITKGDSVKALAVRLLWLGGCRVTELVTLRKESVDLEQKHAVIRNLKHHEFESTKVINWDDETNDLMKEVLVLNDSEWVFASRKNLNSHLTTRQIQRWFVEFREKLGISKKITPHSERRGFVIDNLKVGTPIAALQRMGGWDSLDSLQKYTNIYTNDIKDIATEAMRKRKASVDQKEIIKQIDLEKILKES